MNTGDFRQIDIRSEALLFVVRHPFGIEIIIDVAGDDVGIASFGPRTVRHRQPPLPGNAADPFRKLLSKRTFGDLLADRPNLGRLQRIIKPG